MFACQLQGKESKSGDIFNSNAVAGETEKNAIIERGASVKEQWFISWIGINYPPSPPPSSENVLHIQ